MTDPLQRKYPPAYEKLVPAALVLIGLVVLILLAITVAVALRQVPVTP